NTGVTDISALSDMPLEWLNLFNTGVTDISALSDMPLEWLNLFNTGVIDNQIESVFGSPSHEGRLTIINQNNMSSQYPLAAPKTTPAAKPSSAGTREDMLELLGKMAEEDFNVKARPIGWMAELDGIVHTHTAIFDELAEAVETYELDGQHVDVETLIGNYLDWLMISVFPYMKEQHIEQGTLEQRKYQPRLWQNQHMGYIVERVKERDDLTTAFADYMKNRTGQQRDELGNLLVKLCDNNLDIWYQYLIALAPESNLPDAVEALVAYAQSAATRNAVEKVKAERAYAICYDIMFNLVGEEAAAQYLEKMDEVDMALQEPQKNADREQVRQAARGAKPALLPDGDRLLYRGRSPLRFAPSSMGGGDAGYSVVSESEVKGGEQKVFNMPIATSRNRWAPPSVSEGFMHRIPKKEMKFHLISSMVIGEDYAPDQTIDEENIRKLFSEKDGKVFADTKDPLYFLKYTLFFSRMIGAGLREVYDAAVTAGREDGVWEERSQELMENPKELAQYYYDHAPEQALEDVWKFMNKGGLSFTSSSQDALISAGLSSSSAFTLAALQAMYLMTSQHDIYNENHPLLRSVAHAMERDLGRNTGRQDIIGPFPGFKLITYGLDGELIVEKTDVMEVNQTQVDRFQERVVLFKPGIERAASTNINERKMAYFIREPDSFKAIMEITAIHHDIVNDFQDGTIDAFGADLMEYTYIRSRIHASAVPDYMADLFKDLMDRQLIISGGELAGAMGEGATAVFLATDLGLAETKYDGVLMSRLEAELARIMTENGQFKNAEVAYLKVHEDGPAATSTELFDMPVYIGDDRVDSARKAAAFEFNMFKKILADKIKSKGGDEAGLKVVINLAAAPSMSTFYEELSKLFIAADAKYEKSHTGVTHYYRDKLQFVHLDEYEDFPPQTDKSLISFKSYLKKHVIDQFGINEDQIAYLLDVKDKTARGYGEYYDTYIKSQGGLDISWIGIGENGHMGFNDPPASFTHEGMIRVKLDRACRVQQVRDVPEAYNPNGLRVFYQEGDTDIPDGYEVDDEIPADEGGQMEEVLKNVPQFAWTMTIPSILAAKHVAVIVPTDAKKEAIAALATSDISPNMPATWGFTHKSIGLFVDREAAQDLPKVDAKGDPIPAGQKTLYFSTTHGISVPAEGEDPFAVEAKAASAGTIADDLLKVLDLDEILAVKEAGELDAKLSQAHDIAQADMDIARIILSSETAAKVANIATEIMPEGYEGTIFFNDIAQELPDKQRAILRTMLGKDTPYAAALEQRLGVKVRLYSQRTDEDMMGEYIIVSNQVIGGAEDARYFMYEQAGLDSLDDLYLRVMPMLAIAKGLLFLNEESQTDLMQAIIEALNALTRTNNYSQKMLLEYIDAVQKFGFSALTVVLPGPERYDQEELEKRHRIALAALIAA
ncbi:hypothetical protein ACFL0T_06240, partial [Candidatus Omnitrophota bacterium]